MKEAKDLGFEFLPTDKDTNIIKIKYQDKITEYQVLDVLEFDHVRRRMSVIVQKMGSQ